MRRDNGEVAIGSLATPKTSSRSSLAVRTLMSHSSTKPQTNKLRVYFHRFIPMLMWSLSKTWLSRLAVPSLSCIMDAKRKSHI
jgi:hypothetical protein